MVQTAGLTGFSSFPWQLIYEKEYAEFQTMEKVIENYYTIFSKYFMANAKEMDLERAMIIHVLKRYSIKQNIKLKTIFIITM